MTVNMTAAAVALAVLAVIAAIAVVAYLTDKSSFAAGIEYGRVLERRATRQRSRVLAVRASWVGNAYEPARRPYDWSWELQPDETLEDYRIRWIVANDDRVRS